MSAVDAEPFPRGALIGAAVLISLALIGTTAARIAGVTYGAPPVTNTAPVASLDLSFTDQADGAILVREIGSDRLVAMIQPGTNGFVRGVMRGLAHNRMLHGIGPGPAFRLFEQGGGKIFLLDTATGRLIDLQAFGAGNRDAFKVFLHPGMTVAS